jgi:threonine synthase
MGLPVGKLICASNKNNVLTDFFATGTYDINREFCKTSSPSMDILISSNLERLIFELTGRNFEVTKQRMQELINDKKYSISDIERVKVNKEFLSGYCDEKNCVSTISNFFEEYGYPLDPHTAVAVNVTNKFSDKTNNPVVVLSTASPYKFPSVVYQAITNKEEVEWLMSEEGLKANCELTIKMIEKMI